MAVADVFSVEVEVAGATSNFWKRASPLSTVKVDFDTQYLLGRQYFHGELWSVNKWTILLTVDSSYTLFSLCCCSRKLSKRQGIFSIVTLSQNDLTTTARFHFKLVSKGIYFLECFQGLWSLYTPNYTFTILSSTTYSSRLVKEDLIQAHFIKSNFRITPKHQQCLPVTKFLCLLRSSESTISDLSGDTESIASTESAADYPYKRLLALLLFWEEEDSGVGKNLVISKKFFQRIAILRQKSTTFQVKMRPARRKKGGCLRKSLRRN
jgi:hypothetical protein